MEKKIHEIMRGIMLDEHALDRSKSRGQLSGGRGSRKLF